MPKGVEHHRTHHLSDELDGLLRAYFRAAMPDPWPAAPGAAPPRRPGPLTGDDTTAGWRWRPQFPFFWWDRSC